MHFSDMTPSLLLESSSAHSVPRWTVSAIARHRQTDVRTMRRSVLCSHRSADFTADKDRRKLGPTVGICHADEAAGLTKLDGRSVLDQQLACRSRSRRNHDQVTADGSMDTSLVADFRAFDPRSTERSRQPVAHAINVNHRLTASSQRLYQDLCKRIATDDQRLFSDANAMTREQPSDGATGHDTGPIVVDKQQVLRVGSRRVDVTIRRQLIQRMIRRSSDEAKLT